ncbi:unnamed protein product [Rotaria sordida]|uniref:Uncharacterized protein n=1 Tax=Rotaria sordida TaxID=392033 RepID=A0A814R1F2_9BILA|nr:unnamed protein product [Rotaria sordida]CAF1350548.1 unnamed protein product [Rotaria sordida]
MSFEEIDTEDSASSLSEVSSLDDEFDTMHLDSDSSEEVTDYDDDDDDDDVDSHTWSEIELEYDAEFLEDHGLIEDQDLPAGIGHAQTIVMKLLDGFDGCYRTVVADNFFTSISLAKYLLEHDTYLIGTLRSNRVGSGSKVLEENLSRGEVYGLQNKDGIKLISWFVCILTCYYVIRPISIKLVRFILTSFLYILLSYITCQNLPRFDVSATLTVVMFWLMSIRLISLTSFSTKTLLTFQTFLLKTLWMCFPILLRKTAQNQWPIIFSIILIIIKLLINHWTYRWFMKCEMGFSYQRTFLFCLALITISYVLEIGMIFGRILTLDKYTLESFTNFPIFSSPLREFWGRRYNRIMHTIFKESIFEPIRLEFSSSTIGALTTFIINGLLHAHICLVIFGGKSLFPTFIFFLLHGIAYSIETKMKIQLPKLVGCIITHLFLLITSPLVVKPFIQSWATQLKMVVNSIQFIERKLQLNSIQFTDTINFFSTRLNSIHASWKNSAFIDEGSPFIMLNPPLFINAGWIPKLPVPNFCL